MSTTYYLLERNDFPSPMWVAKPGEGFRGWVTDASEAVRFSTASEAKEAMEKHLVCNRLRVTEHRYVES